MKKESLVGLNIVEASAVLKALNIRCRLIGEDGGLMTADFDPYRWDIFYKDGIVTRVG